MSRDHSKLIRAIKADDENAFEELFFEFYESLGRFAVQYVDSMQVAEGLVQDVYARIWETRSQLDESTNIRAYLYQAVRNKALDHIRHKKVVNKYEDEVELQLYDEVYEMKKKNIIKEGFIAATQKAIEELPDDTRHIYKLNRKDGLTYREISEILDISIKTVEYHISKALRILRNQLRHYLPGLILFSLFHAFIV